MKENSLIPVERIERAILLIRGQKVMLDRDLAALYGVTTGNLNKAVRRNLERFPADFMFQLSEDEAENLRFQNGISSSGYGGRRYLPYAFTEQGVAMLSSVLPVFEMLEHHCSNGDHRLLDFMRDLITQTAPPPPAAA